MAIAALDELPEAAFIVAVGPWFEGAPRFMARLARARPFGDESTLFARARDIAVAMPEDEQVELIDAHPRLGAPPASVSASSFREQGYDRETTAAMAELERLNDAYEARFGFRFCVFVNGRSRPALVPVLQAALQADRRDEIRRALDDVVAIAEDRHRKARAAEEVTA
ncbi:MAG TPA: 2-oxo-4-hydroxy-4-carboxy-5-ureidoimidazoline decarboxylase [Candidatus Limnocylindrales bacterium]|nr:2-oxo-4-hydroxy-4-carboxy-5-ureidoimidazoline decarboxylase [Candidatus Limnocylindrales bacterium]